MTFCSSSPIRQHPALRHPPAPSLVWPSCREHLIQRHNRRKGKEHMWGEDVPESISKIRASFRNQLTASEESVLRTKVCSYLRAV